VPTLRELRLTVDDAVTLSPLTAEDAPALVEAAADPQLRRWLPLPSPYTLDTALDWCTSTTRSLRESGQSLIMAVRHDGRFGGSIEVKRIDWRAMTCELTYWTSAPLRGRSIMPTVVTRLSRWLIDDEQFQRVELRVSPDNHASVRVAEKAGFTLEGTARNAGFTDAGRVDLAIYSLIPADRDSPIQDPVSGLLS